MDNLIDNGRRRGEERERWGGREREGLSQIVCKYKYTKFNGDTILHVPYQLAILKDHSDCS